MSRPSLALVVVLGLLADCGSDGATIKPTPLPTNAVFTGTLSAAQIVPQTDAPPGGAGNFKITLNMTRDSAGNITAATVDFLATFTGFPAGTTVPSAHIHTGALGSSGGAVISTGIGSGEVTMPNGSGSLVKNGVSVLPVDVANQILNNPAGFYFDVHTPANPAGAARGQLARVP